MLDLSLNVPAKGRHLGLLRQSGTRLIPPALLGARLLEPFASYEVVPPLSFVKDQAGFYHPPTDSANQTSPWTTNERNHKQAGCIHVSPPRTGKPGIWTQNRPKPERYTTDRPTYARGPCRPGQGGLILQERHGERDACAGPSRIAGWGKESRGSRAFGTYPPRPSLPGGVCVLCATHSHLRAIWAGMTQEGPPTAKASSQPSRCLPACMYTQDTAHAARHQHFLEHVWNMENEARACIFTSQPAS
jgi:hypothetical protein